MLKRKKTGKTAAGKRLCQCTDVTVYVVYNLSHDNTERTYTFGVQAFHGLAQSTCCHFVGKPLIEYSEDNIHSTFRGRVLGVTGFHRHRCLSSQRSLQPRPQRVQRHATRHCVQGKAARAHRGPHFVICSYVSAISRESFSESALRFQSQTCRSVSGQHKTSEQQIVHTKLLSPSLQCECLYLFKPMFLISFDCQIQNPPVVLLLSKRFLLACGCHGATGMSCNESCGDGQWCTCG